MTFREDAKFDTTTVRRRGGGGGGRGGAIAIGGGGLLTVVLFLASAFFGIDLTGLGGGGTTADQGSDVEITGCTGADANDPANLDCRMEAGADSLSQYWETTFSQNGLQGYVDPSVLLYDAQVSTGCGQASSAVGPFYCPADQQIYVDTSFFALMQQQFGAQGGPTAQLYVLAHEWGHHIQQLTGDLQNVQPNDTGPAGSAVRSELQADCYAGAWLGQASGVNDDDGSAPVLEPITQEQLNDALDAAMVIGDDSIQEHSGQGIDPDAWTHGSSQQRQTWLGNGFTGGAAACAAVWDVAQP